MKIKDRVRWITLREYDLLAPIPLGALPIADPREKSPRVKRCDTVESSAYHRSMQLFLQENSWFFKTLVRFLLPFTWETIMRFLDTAKPAVEGIRVPSITTFRAWGEGVFRDIPQLAGLKLWRGADA
ncbi:MAG TPA: hypothetical protein VFM21_04515 [Terriglobia bacterium]|nr:hypothetical protein [Terriglobia bacterium]